MKGLCLILRKSSSYAKNKFALQKPTLLAQKKCGIICLEKSNIAEKDAHIVAAGFNGVIRLFFIGARTEVRVYLIGCQVSFTSAGVATFLKFAHQANISVKFFVFSDVENGIFSAAIFRKENRGTLRDVV